LRSSSIRKNIFYPQTMYLDGKDGKTARRTRKLKKKM
jgi:hypothetical protein